MSGAAICLILVLIFLLMSLPLMLARRKQLRHMADACSGLARRTGMNTITPLPSPPGILFNLGSWTIRHAGVAGTYRGRAAAVSMTGEGGGWTGEYAESNPYQYAVVSVAVTNSAAYRLKIRAKGFLARFFRRTDVATSNARFDERLVIKGRPQDFLQRIAAWIPRIAAPLLAWMIEERPAITLGKSRITCKHSLVSDIEKQILTLDFICDMADFIERSGSTSLMIPFD